MADDKLLKISDRQFNPTVQSAAQPTAGSLLEARAALNSSPQLRELFHQAFMEDRDDAWLAAQLSDALNERLGAAEALAAATYLVDEYRQLGEGVHLVSTETGRVFTTLAEGDVWQGPAVPRTSGGMATPLPQLRPDLSAYIASWSFDRSREEAIVAELARRGHQTALLAEDGDPRLLVATRAGRRHIVEELGKFRPEALLRACGGTSAAFLKCFELTETAPLNTSNLYKRSVNSQSIMGVQDQTTVNLRHNRPAALRGGLTQGWVREVARALAEIAATELKSSPVALRDIDKMLLQSKDVWVVPPEAYIWIRRADPHQVVVLVPGLRHIVGVKAEAGVLVVPEQFQIGSREIFDRWETQTELDFQLCLDWAALSVYEPQGLIYDAVVI